MITLATRPGSATALPKSAVWPARRKFYDLHEANKSELAAKALEYIGGLYEIERETKDLPPDMRREIRQTKAKPLPMRCIGGCWPIARKCRMLRHGQSPLQPQTLGADALLDDALCPSTTTGKPDPTGRWGAAIGCLRVHCAVVNVRLRS
ncbi:IS66 family transposase [Klebsiella pneumoniae]|uniref:IS66 family transposase n=1 Tax=Klebsiella pneumoniae TaxID=573 RepID=UPI00226596E1|nr:transposase [Klebsiella pneumoniae]